jgi:DNA-binding CsgD family transcriptional regulator/tetratricopeptide (TPR) repeat protein
MINDVPRRLSSGHLVGRVHEVQRAREVLRTVVGGRAERSPRVILISGEAGIGKTRLLEDLLTQARGFGAVVASGGCVEHGGEIRPLGAVRDLVGQLLATAGDGWIDRAPDLARMLAGGAGDRPAGPGADPGHLHHQVRMLLAGIAASVPLVLAVEDLHWADEATRRLVADLARSSELDRVALVATYRSDELHRRHPLLPLLADLEHAARPERIELAPLADEDIIDLAGAILGGPLGAEAGKALARRSGGNPFYAEELLAADAVGARLPTGVRHVILARSQGLSSDAIRCLEAAAALAAPVGSDLLRATAALDAERFRAAIDSVCRERFLVEGADGFRFRHDLVREVVLGELLPGERTALFARAADALERHRPERIGEIARLRFLAVQLEEALAAAVRAAASAESIGAPAEANEHYGRALDLWNRVDDPARCAGTSRVTLLRRASRAADQARDFDFAVDLGRRAVAEATGTAEEGPALNELAGYLWNAGAPGREEVIERAAAVMPREPSADRARLEMKLAGQFTARGEHDAADAALERAAAMAAQLGERGIEAEARAHIGYHRAELGDEAVLRQIYDALRLAMSVDDGRATCRIFVNLSNLLVFLGRFEDAADLYDAGVAAAERHGLLPTIGLLFQGNVIEALEALGRWHEAGRIVEGIERRHTPESLHRWASALSGWSQILVNRGRYEVAAATYGRGWELHGTGYYSGEIGQLGTGVIELAAAGVIDPVPLATVDTWMRELPPGEATFGARMVAAAARHLVPPPTATDHQDAAGTVQAWIDRLQDVADRQYVTVPRLLDAWLDQARIELAESRGLLDPPRWAALSATWAAEGCPYFAAVAQYRHAAALLRAGGARSAADRLAATDLLAAAHRTAAELGAEPLMRDIADVARRAHLRTDLARHPRPDEATPAEPPPFGLTRREVEVLHLVTEGRSNGEIGTALYISTKTASVHVSNILRKLGAANRIEAAAIARRHRL